MKGKESSEGEQTRSMYIVYNDKEVSSIRIMRTISVGSGLSARKVERIKTWVCDKDREEKKNNIIIKEVKILKDIEKDWKECRKWASDLIKEKMEVK